LRKLILLIGVFLVFIPVLVFGQTLKLGFVDVNILLEQSPGREEAEKKFQSEAIVWKDRADGFKKELETLVAEYDNQKLILSPAKKKEREALILEKQKEYEIYLQEVFGPKGKSNQKEAELMAPILEKVNKAIESVRVAGGYALIFDARAGAIVAGDPSMDLTEQVLAELKKTTAASTTTSQE